MVYKIYSNDTRKQFFVEVPDDNKKDYVYICMHILREKYNDSSICAYYATRENATTSYYELIVEN